MCGIEKREKGKVPKKKERITKKNG
jgi:hypothetical protein